MHQLDQKGIDQTFNFSAFNKFHLSVKLRALSPFWQVMLSLSQDTLNVKVNNKLQTKIDSLNLQNTK